MGEPHTQLAVDAKGIVFAENGGKVTYTLRRLERLLANFGYQNVPCKLVFLRKSG